MAGIFLKPVLKDLVVKTAKSKGKSILEINGKIIRPEYVVVADLIKRNILI